MKNSAKERRLVFRLHDSLVVRHRVLGSKTHKLRSVTKDLSARGVALPTDRRINPRSVLEMEILIPMQILPVFALGEIVWMKEEWENARRLYGIGVHITDMDEFDEERIRAYIQERKEEGSE